MAKYLGVLSNDNIMGVHIEIETKDDDNDVGSAKIAGRLTLTGPLVNCAPTDFNHPDNIDAYTETPESLHLETVPFVFDARKKIKAVCTVDLNKVGTDWIGELKVQNDGDGSTIVETAGPKPYLHATVTPAVAA